jgi:two-component system response regulator PrrA
VLVVEDDAAVRDAVVRGLGLHGFDVTAVGDAEQGLAEVPRRRPDVLVVDVGLPGMSGIELCRSLRAAGLDTPVLVLSAREQVGDRVAGLEAGADDYVVKPFDLTELVLRLQALLRRAATTLPAEVHVVGPLWIDVERRLATIAGTPVELSRREFDLAAALAANAGIVLTRLRLLELVWGYDFEVDTNVVDVFVGYLRRKFAAAGAPPLIHTVRGVGFVMRAAAV